MEDFDLFPQLASYLLKNQNSQASVNNILQYYAQVSLETLERIPKLVSFLVEEEEKYSLERHIVLRKELTQAKKYVAQHLAIALSNEELQSRFSTEQLVTMLNALLLDYFTFELTREKKQLWLGKKDFFNSVVELFLDGAFVKTSKQIGSIDREASLTENATAVTTATQIAQNKIDKVEDLHINLVHSILERANQKGRQKYALVYVLFAAGLSPEELVNLQRVHLFHESGQHIVQVNRGNLRQIPLNQWILGKRYGFPHAEPLTQWLKTHKNEQLALFINDRQKPLSEGELRILWQDLTKGLLTPQAQLPKLKQVRQTWCIEMLMKGISLENLSILSGIEIEQLQPFAQRAKEKAAIEQAYRLDRLTNER